MRKGQGLASKAPISLHLAYGATKTIIGALSTTKTIGARRCLTKEGGSSCHHLKNYVFWIYTVNAFISITYSHQEVT
jgi:hypothetical protein